MLSRLPPARCERSSALPQAFGISGRNLPEVARSSSIAMAVDCLPVMRGIALESTTDPCELEGVPGAARVSSPLRSHVLDLEEDEKFVEDLPMEEEESFNDGSTAIRVAQASWSISYTAVPCCSVWETGVPLLLAHKDLYSSSVTRCGAAGRANGHPCRENGQPSRIRLGNPRGRARARRRRGSCAPSRPAPACPWRRTYSGGR